MEWIYHQEKLLTDVVIPLTITSPHVKIREAGRLCLKACLDSRSPSKIWPPGFMTFSLTCSAALDKDNLKNEIRKALQDCISDESGKCGNKGPLIIVEELIKFDESEPTSLCMLRLIVTTQTNSAQL